MAQGSGIELGPLIAAKVIYCGGLALAATGALSGFGAWLIGDGYLWIGAAAGVLLFGALRYRHRSRADAGVGAKGRPRVTGPYGLVKSQP